MDRISISSTINNGDKIDKAMMHMSMPPTLKAMSYHRLGAQMGGPICHKSIVPIYSISKLDFGNYN